MEEILMMIKEAEVVMIIGKNIILSFSDAEEHIVDKLKCVMGNGNNTEYVEIMPEIVLSFANLIIYIKEHEVYKNGKLIPLSNQEFLLLQFLVRHPKWVHTKEELYNVVCGENL